MRLSRMSCVGALLMATLACGEKRSADSAPLEIGLGQSRASVPAPAPAAPPPPMAPAESVAVSQQPPAQPASRKIIRNANQTLEVAQIEPALDAVRRAVTEMGGYTTEESQRVDEGSPKAASITCRIPAEKLDDTIARFRQLGKQEELTITAEDISEAYADLEVQLANQKKLEARLLDLLGRQTNRLTDLLEIERETARVRGEIDRMEGRKRYWDNRLALSTLTVAVHEPRPAIASAGGGPWRTLLQAFGDAGDNFVLSIAGIISATGALLPLVAALVILFLIVRWALRRRRAAKLRAQA